MKLGDTVMIRGKDGKLVADILNTRIEVRELEPLSFDEAKALVILLGGSQAMPPLSPGVGLMPQRHHVTPLQTLFASLPPRQRQAFMECMDRVWPRNKRDALHFSRNRPAANWDYAWAAALNAASLTRENAMSRALIAARDGT